jgi:hypothetical protein
MFKVGDRVLLCELNQKHGTSKKRWVCIKKILLPITIPALRGLTEKVNQYLSDDNERFSETRIIESKK